MTAARRRALAVVPRLKVWFEVDGQYVFGHRLCEILAAVDETGSIKHAAERFGFSYRYVWGRVKLAERRLGRPLVLARVGGPGRQRSELTPLGRQLMEEFASLRTRMQAALAEARRQR
jgi:molybdate transport system regulatory protein